MHCLCISLIHDWRGAFGPAGGKLLWRGGKGAISWHCLLLLYGTWLASINGLAAYRLVVSGPAAKQSRAMTGCIGGLWTKPLICSLSCCNMTGKRGRVFQMHACMWAWSCRLYLAVHCISWVCGDFPMRSSVCLAQRQGLQPDDLLQQSTYRTPKS